MALVDEQVVLRSYLEQMKNDNVSFLKGRDYFKDNISKEINLLLKEENMHKKIMISKNLWKLLFEAAMSYIDPDKRGYDDIFSYFDEYVNFEELIFASDSFYRDHTMHCLWVYFLGEYIKKSDDYKGILVNKYKETQKMIEDAISSIRTSNHTALFEDFLYLSECLDNLVNNEEAIWCISSLTHDLGYPIKKIGKINKSIQKILPYFHVNNYAEFNFNYSDVQQGFINDFIRFLSYDIGVIIRISASEGSELGKIFKKVLIEQSGKLSFDANEIDKLNETEYEMLRSYLSEGTSIQMQIDFTKRLIFSNDFENYEHGIMSAFLLMKTIHSFNTFKFTYNDYKKIKRGEVDVAKLGSIHEILDAVSYHTCSKFQIKGIYNTSHFLALIDELEEFSRISRANQSRQYVEEFCKTDLSFVDGWLQVDFIFDNSDLENLDPEFAFKGRCKKFLTLFDIFNLDENLKIRLRCIDKVLDNNKVYCLEIARKYANITINGEEQNIPNYLRSKIFYTKEEYAVL